MNPTIKQLRRKYFFTASAISLCVIISMILAMNILMHITYSKQLKATNSMICQAGFTAYENTNIKKYNLANVSKNEDGDYIIPESIDNIATVTLHGSITCTDKSATWYCAGGGVLFPSGEHLQYKEYNFNKGTTDITIDFTDTSDLKTDNTTTSITDDKFGNDYFLVSIIWWKNKNGDLENTDDISVNIENIQITYKYNQNVSNTTYANIFDEMPELLKNTSSFYMVCDKDMQILSICSGNLSESLPVNVAFTLLEDTDRQIQYEGVTYHQYKTEKNGNYIISFISDDTVTNKNLLWISITVGFAFFFILLLIIWIISGSVIKPVAESFERQENFISNASHELKTPITVINGTVDIIIRQSGDTKWTSNLKAETQKMQHLVYELLDISRLSNNKEIRKKFEICNVSKLAENTLLYFESSLYQNNKHLNQNIQKELTLNCDGTRISQLIDILIDNAIKYSDEESTINFKLYHDNKNIIMECINPCSNFYIANTQKLFERFYRNDNDISNKKEGFGLGLSIAEKIVNLHKGKIQIDYKDSMFIVRIAL